MKTAKKNSKLRRKTMKRGGGFNGKFDYEYCTFMDDTYNKIADLAEPAKPQFCEKMSDRIVEYITVNIKKCDSPFILKKFIDMVKDEKTFLTAFKIQGNNHKCIKQYWRIKLSFIWLAMNLSSDYTISNWWKNKFEVFKQHYGIDDLDLKFHTDKERQENRNQLFGKTDMITELIRTVSDWLSQMPELKVLRKIPHGYIHVVVETNTLENLKVTLDNPSVNVNEIDSNGNTPLIIAATKDKTDMCALLIKHGADVNLTDKDGNTPLIIAVIRNNRKLCKEILNTGKANVDHENNSGKSAICIAADTDKQVMMALIKKYGANDCFSMKNVYGNKKSKSDFNREPTGDEYTNVLKVGDDFIGDNPLHKPRPALDFGSIYDKDKAINSGENPLFKPRPIHDFGSTYSENGSTTGDDRSSEDGSTRGDDDNDDFEFGMAEVPDDSSGPTKKGGKSNKKRTRKYKKRRLM